MSEEVKLIYPALAEIMADSKAIGKDSKNSQQGFNFRGIDAVMNHLHPLFAKHGVVVMPEVLEERAEERTTKSGGNLIYRVLRIAYNFVASDGSQARAVVVGEGMDSGDKAANKAMAVGLKYALTQMLLLPYDEVDPDADTPPESKPKAAPRSKASVKESGTSSENVVVAAVDVVRKKEGKSARGGWTSFGVKVDGVYYNTFDSTIGALAQEAADAGRLVRLEYKVNDKGYNDITDLSFADSAETGEQAEEPLPF